MQISRLLFGVWLSATPLFLLAENSPDLLRLTLDESTAKVAELLGKPTQVGEAGPGHFVWHLQVNQDDHHDPSHILLFRKADRRLVSVTQNFEAPTAVDTLFPEEESHTYYWQEGKAPRWPARVRLLPGGRVLVAMGVAKAGEGTTQLLLIRRSAVPQYLPWLAEQLPDL